MVDSKHAFLPIEIDFGVLLAAATPLRYYESVYGLTAVQFVFLARPLVSLEYCVWHPMLVLDKHTIKSRE